MSVLKNGLLFWNVPPLGTKSSLVALSSQQSHWTPYAVAAMAVDGYQTFQRLWQDLKGALKSLVNSGVVTNGLCCLGALQLS